MNKKTASTLLVILSAGLLAVGILGGCANTNLTTSSTTIPAAFNFFMQEEPNTLFLTSHFSLLDIGRIEGLPNGPNRTTISTDGKSFPPAELERDVKVFYTGENIVIYGHVIAGTSIIAACFKDGESGYTKIDYWGPETFSNEYLATSQGAIIVGYNPPAFILPTYLKLTPGNYRLKIFSGETLVAVFPFDVWEAPPTLLYPVPKISEDQAFEMAKQLVPHSVLYAERIVTVLSISQPESHGVWTTFFTGLHITKQELLDFGWRQDAITSFGETDTYSQIWIGADAQTGEVIQKIAWNGIKLGGPIQPTD